MFSRIIQWLREYDRTCLVLLDREVLAGQTALRIRDYLGEMPGVACASLRRKNLSFPITIASRQTMAPMLKNGHKDIKFNIVILDEAHLVSHKRGQYKDIIDRLRDNYPDTRIFGCTATPYRLQGGPIYGPGKLFDQIDYKITAAELLEAGYICPLKWKYRASDLQAQLDQVEKMASGELNEAQQAAVLEQPKFIRGVYDIWRQYAEDRKTCVYALNITHAEKIQEVFRGAGVKTWIIHSKMKIYDVRAAIREYTEGSGVMINVGILTIGSDIPSINAIILARRTLSTALHFQIVGRGQRISPGKTDCRILDLCGNYFIHGPDVDNPLSVTMDDDHAPKQAYKICPICETATGMQTRTCPDCGFKFPMAEIEEFERQGKLRDAGDPGELVDAVPFSIEEAHYIKYVKHRVGHGESVCAFYYGVPPVGKFIGRQYLFTDYRFGKTNVDKSRYYWFNLGGKYPAPKNPSEWIARAEELTGHATVTLDVSGKKGSAIIKKVEGQGRETPAQAV
jgi:superfamily II DNA or RNA helicase